MIYIRPWGWVWNGNYTKDEMSFIFSVVFYEELALVENFIATWEDAKNDALWEARCFIGDLWGIMAFAIDEVQDRNYSIMVGVEQRK